jgi:hypothetical protein
MSQVVPQSDSLGEVFIETKGLGQGAGYLGDF